MIYKLKQSVKLGGKDYKKGLQDLSQAAEQDPLFLKYVGVGLIIDAEKKEEVKETAIPESAQKILKRIQAQKEKKAEAALKIKEESKDCPPCPPEEEIKKESEEIEDFVEAKKEKPKAKNPKLRG